MHPAPSAVIRILAISVAITIYSSVVSSGERGGRTDADIGAGLVGFAGLMLLSLGWALVDGRTRSLEGTIVSWGAVAATVSIGWWIVRAIVDADSSSSVAENLVADLSLTFFVFGLVLVPACVGALIGVASRRGDPT